jgi:hypothetical protein
MLSWHLNQSRFGSPKERKRLEMRAWLLPVKRRLLWTEKPARLSPFSGEARLLKGKKRETGQPKLCDLGSALSPLFSTVRTSRQAEAAHNLRSLMQMQSSSRPQRKMRA